MTSNQELSDEEYDRTVCVNCGQRFQSLTPDGYCPECEDVYFPGRRNARERLEYLRGEIEAERISYGEIAELQGLAAFIDPGDVQLLQWAGVPEFDDE